VTSQDDNYIAGKIHLADLKGEGG